MQRLDKYKELEKLIENKKDFLLYLKTGDCNVCDAMVGKMLELEKESPIHFYYADIIKAQDIRGQVIVFTVPTVILYKNGLELTRYSRFIKMNELKENIQKNY